MLGGLNIHATHCLSFPMTWDDSIDYDAEANAFNTELPNGEYLHVSDARLARLVIHDSLR
jgi:hypothetical protein